MPTQPSVEYAYISIPGPAFTDNPYFALLVGGLRKHGAEVISPTILNLIRRRVILLMHFPDHCVTEGKLRHSIFRTLKHLVLAHDPFPKIETDFRGHALTRKQKGHRAMPGDSSRTQPPSA